MIALLVQFKDTLGLKIPPIAERFNFVLPLIVVLLLLTFFLLLKSVEVRKH